MAKELAERTRPSVTPTKLIEELEEKWESWAQIRRMADLYWYMAVAFYHGRQRLSIDRETAELLHTPDPEGRVQRTYNWYKKFIRAAQARLLINPAMFATIPSAPDQPSIDAAEVGKKLLQHYWRPSRLGLRQLNDRALQWMITTGTVFKTIHWDPSRGPLTVIPQQEEIVQDVAGEFLPADAPRRRVVRRDIFDDDGQPLVSVQPEGDLSADYLSPFQVVPEPTARCMDDLLECFTHEIVTLGQLHNWFGDKAKKVGEEDVSSRLSSWELHAYDWMAGKGHRDHSEDVHKTVLFKYYARPGIREGKDWERGRWVWWANGVELLNEEPPQFDDHDISWKYTIPLVMYKAENDFDNFWGTSFSYDMMDPCKEYNRFRSLAEESMVKASIPRYQQPMGDTVEDDMLVDVPALVMRYSGSPLQLMEPYHLPDSFMRLMLDTPQTVEQLISQPDVSRGEQLTKSESGFQAQLLIEQSNQVNQPTIDAWNESEALFAQYMLALCQLRLPEKRIIAAFGDNGLPEVLAFKRSQLLSTEVFIIPGTGKLTSESNEQRKALNLWAQKLTSREQTLRSFSLGHDLESGQRDIQIQEQRVKHQIELMKNGIEPQIHEEQDSGLAMSMVFRETLQISFDEQPQEIQQLFGQYLQIMAELHRRRLGAQQPAAAQQPGSPQPTPQPGQPSPARQTGEPSNPAPTI